MASVTSGASTSANDLSLDGTTNPDGSTITAANGSGTSLSGTVTNDGTLLIDSTGDETVVSATDTARGSIPTARWSSSARIWAM